MSSSTIPTPPRVRRGAAGLVGLAVSVVAVIVLLASPALAAVAAIGLGTASSFAVLAGSGVTNTGATTITGDVGTHPTPAMTGFDTVVLTGTNHGADAVTQQAKSDLVTAYNQAASGPATSVATELGGTTLTPGVYHGDTVGVTGTLTLDTQGDPDAVFVFQAASTLITASASRVVVLGGATACNVFWQVGSSATLGTDSSLIGTVMAETSITANNAATLVGRLLAKNGAVTLDHNTITIPTCAASAATPSQAATTGLSEPVTTSVPGASTNTALATPGRPSLPARPGLARTGSTDVLPLAGGLAIAFGLLLLRLAQPAVALAHSPARNVTTGRRS